MRTVIYVTSDEVHRFLDRIEKIRKRSFLVDSLVRAYRLNEQQRFHAVRPRIATEQELNSAHDRDYLNFLQTIESKIDDAAFDHEMDRFQIGFECPPFDDLFLFCQTIGGASLTAARFLSPNNKTISINFFGGWHHAKRSEASGFCYVNDIVLAINDLRKRFDRICYFDLDLHHGDGVQEAFYCSSKVLTVSLHKHEPGFFPSNSGSLEEIGDSWGRGFNINFPFRHGVNDEQYLQVFSKLLSKIVDSFNPEVFVVQCGGDTLFADPMKSFNLTSHAIVKCVKQIIDLDKPTLLLGGGGYNIADTARLWTSIVAMCLDVQIDDDIPEHDYFSHYGPDFTLKTWPGNRQNKNDQSHLDEMFHFIEANQIKIIEERNHHSE